MTGLTLLFAIVLSVGVLAAKPKWAIFFYIASFAWYPANLTVPVGSIDFNVPRIVILAVFLKILMSPNSLKDFKLIAVDWLMIIFFVMQIVVCMTTSSISRVLENRLGAIFDILLPYFATRLLIRDEKALVAVMKGIMIVAVPLAIFGFYQAVTGRNVFERLLRHASWGATFQKMELRWGLYRASTTFGVHILYGLFFSMLGPISAGLLKYEKKRKMMYSIVLLIMALGLFSSMSSGPWLCAMLAVSFLFFYKYRKYWKTVLLLIAIACAFVEVVSNRHFYDVFARYALNAATANYRSRLIQVAFFEGGMNGHWMLGYGLESGDPGWGPKIDGRGMTDIVNHYILIMFLYGFPVMLIFVWIIVEAIKRLIRAYKLAINDRQRWMVWCVSASMFGIIPTMCTVSLTAQSKNVFSILLGISVAVPVALNSRRKQLFKMQAMEQRRIAVESKERSAEELNNA